jgi:hypothetical protein
MPILDAWEKGRFTMLVEDTLGSMEAHLTHKQGYARAKDQDLPSKGHLWSSLGCCKILWRAGKGGILYRDDIDKISGNTDQSVLESKHPNAWIPGDDALTGYPFLPDFVDLNITNNTIKVAACHPCGGTGLGGTDVQALQQWLLCQAMSQHGPWMNAVLSTPSHIRPVRYRGKSVLSVTVPKSPFSIH